MALETGATGESVIGAEAVLRDTVTGDIVLERLHDCDDKERNRAAIGRNGG